MMTAGQLMTDGFVAVPYQATVKEATMKMRKACIGSILVEKDNEFVGIVTEPDIVRKVNSMERDPATILVSDIMSSPVISMDTSTSLRDVIFKMAHKEIRHLAITRDGTICGFLSVRDVLGYIAPMLSSLEAEKPVGVS